MISHLLAMKEEALTTRQINAVLVESKWALQGRFGTCLAVNAMELEEYDSTHRISGYNFRVVKP